MIGSPLAVYLSMIRRIALLGILDHVIVIDVPFFLQDGRKTDPSPPEEGILTWRFFALRPLLIRVNMSAIGSLHIACSEYPIVVLALRLALPACLAYARNLALVRKHPETDPADPELLVHRPAPPAQLAPRVGPHLELRGPVALGYPSLRRHVRSPIPGPDAPGPACY